MLFQPSCLPDLVPSSPTYAGRAVDAISASAASPRTPSQAPSDLAGSVSGARLSLQRLSGGDGGAFGGGRGEQEARRAESRHRATAAKAILDARSRSPAPLRMPLKRPPPQAADEQGPRAKYIPGCFLEDLDPPGAGSAGGRAGGGERPGGRGSGGGSHAEGGGVRQSAAKPAVRKELHNSLREYSEEIVAMARRVVGSMPRDAAAPAPMNLDGNDSLLNSMVEDEQHQPAPDMPLTPEQQQALDWVREKRSIFLTGSAGTGKSFLLRHIIAALRKIHPQGTVHVTASTGAAAVLIGGTTVHSFAGVGLGAGDARALVARVQTNKQCLLRWKRARALVIDEISMIDSELFSKISFVAQASPRPLPSPCGEPVKPQQSRLFLPVFRPLPCTADP